MRIKSLEGLRVIICLCIFSAHAHLMLRNQFSVAFFFILSGFVLYYTWNQKITTKRISFKENALWVLIHMKKIYIVHVLLFFISIYIRWDWVKMLSHADFIKKSLLNIFLLQSLTKSPYTFNSLSWYISVLFIFYWVTLPLIKVVKKTSVKMECLITLIVVIQYIINYYYIKVSPVLDGIYSSPLYRSTDFILGMLTARLFLNSDMQKIPDKFFDAIQAVLVIVFTIMLIGSFSFAETCNYFTVFFVIAIAVLSVDRGWLSDLLSARAFQWFAQFCFEFYMIHELIIFCVEKMIYKQYSYLSYNQKNSIVWVVALPIAVIAAFCLHNIIKKITSKKIEVDRYDSK